jgi:hypothetical protein
MGTLMDQKPRVFLRVCEEDIIRFIENCNEIGRATGSSREQVFEAVRILEMRRKNDLYVNSGDVFDEQMAGFGELVTDLSEKLDAVRTAIGEGLEGISGSIQMQMGRH